MRSRTRSLATVLGYLVLCVVFVCAADFDFASSDSPFGVRSGDSVEILQPDNDAVLENQTAVIELKADFNVGESKSKELCVALIHAQTFSIEASQCFTDEIIRSVIFDNLDIGVEYQIKVSLHEGPRQLAITMRAFTVGSVFGETISDALDQAIHDHTHGNYEDAKKIYFEILKISPEHADALHLLGALYLQAIPSKMEEAAELVIQATEVNPDDPNYFNTLGQIYEHLGDQQKALSAYKHSVEMNEFFVTPYLNIVRSYHRSAQYAMAQAFVNSIIQNSTLVLYNKDNDDTLRLYALFCDGYRLQGMNRKSASCFQDALDIWPESGLLWNLLGNTQLAMQEFGNSIYSYEQAVNLGHEEAVVNSALMLDHQGFTQEAEAQYKHALDLLKEAGPHDTINAIKVKLALISPRILFSAEEVATSRGRVEREIEALIHAPEEDVQIHDILSQGMGLGFYWSYHGPPSLRLRSKLSRMYVHILKNTLREDKALLMAPPSPPLFYPLPPALLERATKIKIGFVSRFFYRHSIGKLMEGILRHLRRDIFEVFIYVVLPKDAKDEFFASIKAHADSIVHLPHNVLLSKRTILDDDLDVLVFPEISMDPLTYLLAHFRLARKQAVWWGHPETTGIPTIDYFISMDVEITGASAHYTERLYKLKGIGTYYADPADALSYDMLNHTHAKLKLIAEIIRNDDSKSDAEMLSNIRIYTCAQSLFKLHPEHFDIAVAKILASDPHAHIVLFRGRIAQWTENVLRRLGENIARQSFNSGEDQSSNKMNRVHFIRRRQHTGFLNVLLGSDVVLDTHPFGGGVSNLEAFSVGTPVITHPDVYLRGRLTLAFYREMRLGSRFVRYDISEYAQLAIETANYPTDELRRLIYDRKKLLFSNRRAVEEWERFFIFACQTLNLKSLHGIMNKYIQEPKRNF
jgi:protein O-GlcNAc transferase